MNKANRMSKNKFLDKRLKEITFLIDYLRKTGLHY